MHTLIIHVPAFLTQQGRNVPTTASRILFDKPMHILDKRCLIRHGLGRITLRGTVLLTHATSPAFGDLMGLLKMLNGITSRHRAQKFPSAKSFNIALSNSASASSFLRREFSTSNFLSRFASSHFMPPY